MPEQKSLNVIQDIQQKSKEDPHDFLEWIYQVYWKRTDGDQQAPTRVWMVNITSF